MPLIRPYKEYKWRWFWYWVFTGNAHPDHKKFTEEHWDWKTNEYHQRRSNLDK